MLSFLWQCKGSTFNPVVGKLVPSHSRTYLRFSSFREPVNPFKPTIVIITSVVLGEILRFLLNHKQFRCDCPSGLRILYPNIQSSPCLYTPILIWITPGVHLWSVHLFIIYPPERFPWLTVETRSMNHCCGSQLDLSFMGTYIRSNEIPSPSGYVHLHHKFQG